jgi:hypothetical protein
MPIATTAPASQLKDLVFIFLDMDDFSQHGDNRETRMHFLAEL